MNSLQILFQTCFSCTDSKARTHCISSLLNLKSWGSHISLWYWWNLCLIHVLIGGNRKLVMYLGKTECKEKITNILWNVLTPSALEMVGDWMVFLLSSLLFCLKNVFVYNVYYIFRYTQAHVWIDVYVNSFDLLVIITIFLIKLNPVCIISRFC